MKISRAAVAVVAAGAGGVAYAADGSSTPATSSTSSPSSGPSTPTKHDPHGKHANRRTALGRAVHGVVTVKTKDGYKSVQLQRGTITADAGGKITVTSVDRFAHAYSVTSTTKIRVAGQKSTADKLATGQRVLVRSSASDGTGVAAIVVARPAKAAGH